jgi:hypothetical protein
MGVLALSFVLGKMTRERPDILVVGSHILVEGTLIPVLGRIYNFVIQMSLRHILINIILELQVQQFIIGGLNIIIPGLLEQIHLDIIRLPLT